MNQNSEKNSLFYSSMSVTARPLYYLGDSHALYFERAAREGLFAPRKVSGISIGGATAMGLGNPNSVTNAKKNFLKGLKKQPSNSLVCIHLGEVDCGFVIWYRAQKYGENLASQLEKSISEYLKFIDEIMVTFGNNVIITSPTLPTITDSDIDGEVVKKRSIIKTTQKDRTSLTLEYNYKLKRGAEARGLHFVETMDSFIDESTGLVSSKFRNPDPLDHHMRRDLAAAIWAQKINNTLQEIDYVSKQRIKFQVVKNTFAKGSSIISKNLIDDLKFSINSGDIVEADFDGETDQYWIVSNCCVNGQKIPEHIRMLFRGSIKPITNFDYPSTKPNQALENRIAS